MNIVIKPEAIQLLEKSKEPNPFIKDLIAISKEEFSGNNDNLNPLTNAALLVINQQSLELHAKRSNAGKKSAFVRLSDAEKPIINVPMISTPAQIGPWSSSPSSPLVIASNQRMMIRYIFFRRNYAMAEEDILFNTFCKGKNQISCASEIIGKAQSWDNFGRPSFCPIPQLYDILLGIEPKLTPVLRGKLLNKKIQFIPRQNEDGYNIYISEDLWQILKPNINKIDTKPNMVFNAISSFA